jgi:hypothetical protein
MNCRTQEMYLWVSIVSRNKQNIFPCFMDGPFCLTEVSCFFPPLETETTFRNNEITFTKFKQELYKHVD